MPSSALALCSVLLVAACAARPSSGPDPAPSTETVPNARLESVIGQVVDASGSPAVAHVSLVHAGGSRSQGIGADGRFAFDGLPSVVYVLRAHTADGRVAQSVDVAPDGAEHRLVLRPGATVALSLAGRPRARVALIQAGRSVHDTTLRADGQAQRPVVVPGPTLVRVYDGGEVLFERTLDLAAGESIEFPIVLGG
jgi:hypothetical protein